MLNPEILVWLSFELFKNKSGDVSDNTKGLGSLFLFLSVKACFFVVILISLWFLYSDIVGSPFFSKFSIVFMTFTD